MISAHNFLRSGTRASHERVDRAFSRFDLGEVGSYRSFLASHARAVVPIERVLADSSSLPPWRSRLNELGDDLHDLGTGLPSPLALIVPDGAGEFAGMLYVIEGSRLGGGVLSKRVGEGLPTAYLSAVHRQGEWSALLMAFDALALAEGPKWLDEAIVGAQHAFDVFADAAN